MICSQWKKYRSLHKLLVVRVSSVLLRRFFLHPSSRTASAKQCRQRWVRVSSPSLPLQPVWGSCLKLTVGGGVGDPCICVLQLLQSALKGTRHLRGSQQFSASAAAHVCVWGSRGEGDHYSDVTLSSLCVHPAPSMRSWGCVFSPCR